MLIISPKANPEDWKKRLTIIGLVLSSIIFILMLRLWFLQVAVTEKYQQLSVQNYERWIPIEAIRGRILDRNGVVLASNKARYDVILDRFSFSKELRKRSIATLKHLLSVNGYAELSTRIISQKTYSGYLLLLQNVDDKVRFLIEENRIKLPGIRILTGPKRYYPNRELACHLLGYVGEIPERLIKRYREQGYSLGDVIGQSGVEKSYETTLRRLKGKRRVVVFASGYELKDAIPEKIIWPKHGKDLHLTLDSKLQSYTEDFLGASTGAIIIMNPQNGDVLAMASKPNFDIDLFASGISRDDWISLMNNPKHPLQNRAISGLYPMGSVIKMIYAVAGLELGIIGPKDTFSCPGAFYLGRWRFGCWKEHGHGALEVNSAIKHSCDVFFYNLGMKLGINNMNIYAQKFGLGKLTGIELPNEKSGIYPDPDWKKNVINRPWTGGDTVNTSIGQGYLLCTPIQVAVMTCALANGGIIYKPRVAIYSTDIHGNLIQNIPESKLSDIQMHKETAELINNALWRVVNEWGTGYKAKIKGIDICGKTGSAQNPHGECHAWFTCYAPMDNPEVVVTVLVENSGHGGDIAAPIAKQVLEAYFNVNKQNVPDS